MADNKKTQPAAQTQPEKKAAKTENKDKKVPFGTKVKNFFGRIGKYFKDTKNNTITVIIVVAIAAAVLIVLDLIFGGVIHLLIGA